ncbi:caspase family protein [Bradyrhizobium sp. UFLA01-814]|uniref:caspase family protein n=1 Tax=Bradyrhizobium sp. UFLA01-814 TaxID=3023480 RepID=UPI00398A925D
MREQRCERAFLKAFAAQDHQQRGRLNDAQDGSPCNRKCCLCQRQRATHPVKEAEDISEKLESFGFDVILAIEASNADMDKSLGSFKKRLDENDVDLLFFAGHGMQLDERYYPIAIDTDTSNKNRGETQFDFARQDHRHDGQVSSGDEDHHS